MCTLNVSLAIFIKEFPEQNFSHGLTFLPQLSIFCETDPGKRKKNLCQGAQRGWWECWSKLGSLVKELLLGNQTQNDSCDALTTFFADQHSFFDGKANEQKGRFFLTPIHLDSVAKCLAIKVDRFSWWLTNWLTRDIFPPPPPPPTLRLLLYPSTWCKTLYFFPDSRIS